MASEDPNRQDTAAFDASTGAPAARTPADKAASAKARKGTARTTPATVTEPAPEIAAEAGASPAEIEAAVARLTPPAGEEAPAAETSASETLSPEAQEKTETETAPAPVYVPPPRRDGPSPWLALPIGAIAGALAAGAVAYALVETGTLQPQPGGDMQPLLKRLSALEQRPQQDLAPSVAQLDSRVAQLEAARAAVDGLKQELGSVKQGLAALTASSAQSATLAQQAAGLAGQVATLTKKVDDLSTSSLALDRGLAAVVTVGALRDAVLAGRPFTAELDAARKALGTQSGPLDPLAPAAAQGFAPPARLAEKLQDAARARTNAPLPAGQTAPKEGGLVDRLLSSAESLVRVGSTDGAPAPADQTLIDAATAALRTGDMAQALAKLDSLSPEAKAKVKPVVSEITARRDAAAALATLNQQALAAISGKLP